jgi:YVTN family beta-propeller protein
VSNWGGRSVDLLDPETLAVKARIAVGDHPNDLAYSKDGRLFVVNANSNSVSVIRSGRVTETIKTTLEPGDRSGSTPDALALSGDGKRLYVANADNNDVAVIDISDPRESRILGFIPTGWYPSALGVSPDGRRLFVGTAKSSRSNIPALTNDGQTQPDGTGHEDYIGDVLGGALWTVAMPDAAALAHDTRQVRANVPKPHLATADARAIQKNAFSKIKHVLYIIRENRTYDQVFGDMKEGNGDPGLTLFGRSVTPNAHALAQRYVLLDNLYANGEVSEDGHQWCNAAYATDFTEKAWANSYSGRSEPDGDDRLTASEGGYLWDNCRNHHVTYRSYGEYAGFKSNPNSPPVFIGDKGLEGHGCLAWSQIHGLSQHDTVRAAVFIKELRAAEATGQWPQFMVMHLAEDHTQGLQAGAYTPVAHVAANDQALGQIVEAISHSRFWKDTAIFVLEDDAQDGPDHVDCHRIAGLVISPYVRRNAVDHTQYSTASFVHTMELILGLPTMSQYDAAATPLYNSFTSVPLLTPCDALPAKVDLEARNPKTGEGAVASAKLDLSDIDRADPDALNQILWRALKPGVPMPAPVRGLIAVR